MDRVYGHLQESLDKEGTSALPDRVGVTNPILSLCSRDGTRPEPCLSHQHRLPHPSGHQVDPCHATLTFVRQLTRS